MKDIKLFTQVRQVEHDEFELSIVTEYPPRQYHEGEKRRVDLLISHSNAIFLWGDLKEIFEPRSPSDKTPEVMADLILKECRAISSPAGVGIVQLGKYALIVVSFPATHDRIVANDYWKEVGLFIRNKCGITD